MQFASTNVGRRLLAEGMLWFKELGRKRMEASKALLDHLIEHHLLIREENAGKPTIYPLDFNYWTNLGIEYAALARNPIAMALSIRCVRELLSELLPDGHGPICVVDPTNLGQTLAGIPQTISEITHGIDGRLIDLAEVHRGAQAVVLAGLYSTAIKTFLLNEKDHVVVAVFLLGPESAYLRNTFHDLPFETRSIISVDTLQKIPVAIRRSFLWNPEE